MPSVIRARYAPAGYTRWRRRYPGPRWEVRTMARALVEGWLSERPEEQRELRASLVEIGLNRGERAADRVAAIKAVMAADFNAAKMEADATTASQPKVIVVRRIDPQPALPAPESNEGGPGEGSL